MIGLICHGLDMTRDRFLRRTISLTFGEPAERVPDKVQALVRFHCSSLNRMKPVAPGMRIGSIVNGDQLVAVAFVA